MHGLSQQLIGQMVDIAKRFSVQKLILFGSRARGNFRKTSDIDLAIYGLDRAREMAFRAEIDDLPTLLKVDIVPICEDTDTVLLGEIERDGVVLWKKE